MTDTSTPPETPEPAQEPTARPTYEMRKTYEIHHRRTDAPWVVEPHTDFSTASSTLKALVDDPRVEEVLWQVITHGALVRMKP